jgi:hypothetical protein
MNDNHFIYITKLKNEEKKKKKKPATSENWGKKDKKRTLVILGYGFSPPLIIASSWTI